jgi:hypothetical protein
MDANHIFLLFKARPEDSGVHHQLAGKFIKTAFIFKVLEDHEGYLSNLEKKPFHEIEQALDALPKSMYYKAVSLEDLKNGHHPELIKEYKTPALGRPTSKFEYHRVGMPIPQALEFIDGKPYLDGHELSQDEVKLLHNNTLKGHATVQYQKGLINKSEFFEALAKGEDAPEPISESLHNLLHKDTTFPHMGNRKSHEDFVKVPSKGIHLRINANGTEGITDAHGHKTSDESINAIGNALGETLAESGKGSLFRLGKDSFAAHLAEHDDAAKFARIIRAKLEQIPPVNGTHQLSVCIGMGPTHHHAHSALLNAQKEQAEAKYPEGQEKQHVHSLVPGFEGSAPQDEEKSPL